MPIQSVPFDGDRVASRVAAAASHQQSDDLGDDAILSTSPATSPTGPLEPPPPPPPPDELTFGADPIEEDDDWSMGDELAGDEPDETSESPDDAQDQPAAEADGSFFDILATDSDPDLAAAARQWEQKYQGDARQAMRAAAKMQKRLSERDELAALGKQIKENPQEAARLLGLVSQGPADQQAQQQAQWHDYLQRAWGAPDFDPTWEDHIEIKYDEHGQVAGAARRADAPANVPRDVVQRTQAYHQWEAAKLRQLMKDPASALAPVLGPFIQQLARQEAAQISTHAQAASATSAQVQQWLNQQADWLYQPGAPQTDENLSYAGQVFYQGVREATDKGVRDTQGRIQWGMYKVQEAAIQRATAQGAANGLSGNAQATNGHSAPATPTPADTTARRSATRAPSSTNARTPRDGEYYARSKDPNKRLDNFAKYLTKNLQELVG